MSQKRPLDDLDPDYEGISAQLQKRQKLKQEDAKEASITKMEAIIRQQFSLELQSKETEINLIDSRLEEARYLLDQLRACIVSSYYSKAQQTHVQSKAANTSTQGIHPTVKRFLGKTVPQAMSSQPTSVHENHTTPPNEAVPNTHQDHSRADEKISTAKVPPTHTEARGEQWSGVGTPEAGHHDNRGSRFKTKKRIVIGNVSKYLPSEGRDESDPATHKWMVYVRGPRDKPVIDHFVHKVWFFLHPSYKPHDLVEISETPFHLARRGWGEFPVRVQLHFKDPRNKRVDVIHHLKLDQTYTGLQTLGSETVIDVELERDSYDPFNKVHSFPELLHTKESGLVQHSKESLPHRPLFTAINPTHDDSAVVRKPCSPDSSLSQCDVSRGDLVTPPPIGRESVDSGISTGKSNGWTHLQIKCESDSNLSSVPSDTQSGRSSTPALSSPAGASRTGRESSRSADEAGWMHVQIKSEPTTPDRPGSSCSGWTDITHFSTPDRNESQASVPSSPISCFSSEGVSRNSSNMRASAPSPSFKVTVGVDRTKPPANSPCKPAALFQFGGSIGSAKPISKSAQDNLGQVEGQDMQSERSTRSPAVDRKKEKTPLKCASPLQKGISKEPVGGAVTPVSGGTQATYIKCMDSSGKVILIPQHLLTEKVASSSPSVITTNSSTPVTMASPRALSSSAASASKGSVTSTSLTEANMTVVGSGQAQATLTYILAADAQGKPTGSNRLPGSIPANTAMNRKVSQKGASPIALTKNPRQVGVISSSHKLVSPIPVPAANARLAIPLQLSSNTQIQAGPVLGTANNQRLSSPLQLAGTPRLANSNQRLGSPQQLLIQTADGKLQILQAVQQQQQQQSGAASQPPSQSLLKPTSLLVSASTKQASPSMPVSVATATVSLSPNLVSAVAPVRQVLDRSQTLRQSPLGSVTPVRMAISSGSRTVASNLPGLVSPPLRSALLSPQQALSLQMGKQVIIVGDGCKTKPLSTGVKCSSSESRARPVLGGVQPATAVSLLRPGLTNIQAASVSSATPAAQLGQIKSFATSATNGGPIRASVASAASVGTIRGSAGPMRGAVMSGVTSLLGGVLQRGGATGQASLAGITMSTASASNHISSLVTSQPPHPQSLLINKPSKPSSLHPTSAPTQLLTTKIGNKTVILKLEPNTSMVKTSPAPVPAPPALISQVKTPSCPVSSDLCGSFVTDSAVKQEPEDYGYSSESGKDTVTKHLMFKSLRTEKTAPEQPKYPFELSDLCSMEALIRQLVKQHPLLHPSPDKCLHPYCAQSEEEFRSWNVGKRRAAEWYRACMVRRRALHLLTGRDTFHDLSLWSRRQIVTWCRHHGYTPRDIELSRRPDDEAIPPSPPAASHSSALSLIEELQQRYQLVKEEGEEEAEDEIDIISSDPPESCVKVKIEVEDEVMVKREPTQRVILPLGNMDAAVHEVASQIGVSLEPMELAPDVSDPSQVTMCMSVVEQMLLAVTKMFSSDLVRSANAQCYDQRCPGDEISVVEVQRAILATPTHDFLTNHHLGTVLEAPPTSINYTAF